MPTSYHRFAGSSLERLAALSDGVFAVAMTLLVLDLKAPSVPKRAQHPIWSSGGGGSEHALAHGLLHQVAPRLLPYAMSFLTLGIFWVGQQTQLSNFTRSTRALTWIHLTFLLAVTLMPFSTGLLAEDTTYRLSMAVYWLNLFALGVMLFISLRYADRAGLMSDETTEGMRAALRRRIVVYQALYALAALTCLINTYLAIGLLVALQLNSVIAPRIGILDRA
jgi:TMEM175 potassium channel family protein